MLPMYIFCQCNTVTRLRKYYYPYYNYTTYEKVGTACTRGNVHTCFLTIYILRSRFLVFFICYNDLFITRKGTLEHALKKNAFTGAAAYVSGRYFNLGGMTHSGILQRVIVLY